jgi:sporulation protein YlmC with PRC-barrel domain
MRLDLGCSVRCADAAYGELADVIVDPLSRRVTHVVVASHGHRERARLVPIDRVSAADDGLVLRGTVADIDALEALDESAYLRAGEHIAEDPDWDIGTEDVLALPIYGAAEGMGTAIDPDLHVLVNYHRIPKHEVEIRRSSAVFSTDGHHLGHVEGFLIEGGETADIVLERGHLWGRREIVIPAAAVERVRNDSITLSLTKEQVGQLDVRRVHRWF